MPKGVRLVDDIDAERTDKRSCALWWLGQQSFVAKFGERVVYMDPFLSRLPNRQIPPLLAPEQITHADIIIGSHDHADHIDRAVWPALAKASPRAMFVVPEFFLESLPRELVIPRSRFVGLNDCNSVRVKGVKITGIPAAHELLNPDRKGRYPCLSYVIEANGVTIFHGADMCNYEGLQTRLSRWQFDLAILPINGRDAARLHAGCIGNLTYQEAVDLAGALRPGMTIPAHYGMFAGNTENPNLFVDYARVKYPGLRTMLCKPGRKLRVASRLLSPRSKRKPRRAGLARHVRV